MIALRFVRNVVRTLSPDSYKPELHYMRGPGPATKARLLAQKH